MTDQGKNVSMTFCVDRTKHGKWRVISPDDRRIHVVGDTIHDGLRVAADLIEDLRELEKP